MRDPETRRGVPLRAGVSLVAVAATVAATFALAGPASAATGSLTFNPTSATVGATQSQTFVGTVKDNAGVLASAADSVSVTVTQPNPTSDATAGDNPLTLGGATSVTKSGASTTTWQATGTATVNAANGTFSIAVSSANNGTVSISATDSAISGGADTATGTATLNVAAPTSVAMSPKTASAFAGSATTFTVTAKNTDGSVAIAGTPIHVTASEPTPTGGSAPTLTITPTSGSTATGASPQSTTAAVTGAAGQATFTVASNTAGTVTVTAAADNNGSASTTTRDTATLTVIASGSNANATVTNVSVTPSSLKLYKNLTASEDFTVTTTGSGGLAVSLATASYEVKNASGTVVQAPSDCSGTTDSKGQVTCTVGTGSLDLGTYTAVFFVNNATSGATAGPDAGEPQQAVSVVIDKTPTYTGGKISTATNPLPAGQARTIPFTVNVYNSGTTPAAAGISVGVDVHSSVSGINDVRVMGTTDANGTATVNVPVTAAETASGATLTANAFVSESPTVGDGGSIGSTLTVNFAVSTPAVQATTPVQAVKGGTVTIPVAIVDQFGNSAGSGDTLSYDVTSGSNAGTTGTVTVGSNGKVNVVYTDKGATGAADTVDITDLTHPAFDSVAPSGSFAGSTTTATVDYVASVTPAKIDWNGTPGASLTTPVSSSPYSHYTVTVTNSAGEALIGQSVTFTVDRGFVGDSTVTASTGSASYTTTTDPSGHAVVYVGSTTAGTQTITATDGGVSQAGANAITYTALSSAPYTLTLTGPSNIALGTNGQYTAKVTDEYGNGLKNQGVQFSQSGAGSLPGGVTPLSVFTGADGTVTVTVQGGDTAGAGSLVALDSDISSTPQAADTTTAPTDTATAKYTVGTSVSKVKVAGIQGVGVGGTEKIAVRVWNADGSLAAGATVNVKVTGANTASGTATTGSNGELGWFSYTAKHAGTDHVTATIDGKTATTTVTISSAISSHLFHPVAQANGTFLYSVQTIPATAGARVNLFAVYHPGKSDQALFHAGNSTTNAAGRAARATSPGYLVHGHFKHYRAGQTYVLVAKIVGSAGQSNMSSATAK